MAATVYSEDECRQGTPEWFEIRKGLPTASEFSKVMAKVGPRGGTSHKEYVGRMQYMRELAGEIITGEVRDAEWLGNRHTERGKEREAEARDLYALMHDVEPQRVGFIRNGNCGASPDSLIGDDGGLEIKDCLPHLQIERLQDKTLPGQYKWQVIGSLLVSERGWWDFMSHSRGLPPFITRVRREDVQQELAELRAGIDRFVEELNLLVEWVRRMW
jgi:hypothetical protein